MDLDKFRKRPLLGILRGIEPHQVVPVVEASVSAGLEAIEITMNTAGAAQLIRKAADAARGRIAVGAGTVLDLKSLGAALESGASFIVMPVIVDEVARHCMNNRIPFFPGALTPNEIYRAWQSGAAMVKVFPSNLLGPDYFREIRGPFQSVGLLACGGVTPENIADYFLNGASAAAFGAGVFRKEWLSSGDYDSVTALIKKYFERIPGRIYRKNPPST